MRNGKYKKAIKPRLISCMVRLLSTPVASAGLSKIKATKMANTSNSTTVTTRQTNIRITFFPLYYNYIKPQER